MLARTIKRSPKPSRRFWRRAAIARRGSCRSRLKPTLEHLEPRCLLDAGLAGELLSTPGITWSSYIGGDVGERGTGGDAGYGVATDSAGAVYVAGQSDTIGWPSGGYDVENNWSGDGFLVKLDASGAHDWSTYLGGEQSMEFAYGVAVDPLDDSVVVVGQTASNSWISGGYDVKRGGYDGFVVKLSSSGEHLWSSYVGGSDSEQAFGVAVDSTGNIVVVGQTYSDRWVSDGVDTTLNGDADCFVVKLSPAGEHLWSTYLGGANRDDGHHVAIDVNDPAIPDDDAIIVCGDTQSPGWTTSGALNGESDAFLARLSADGQLEWSQYLGGSDREDVGISRSAVAVNASGDVFMAGSTYSSDWQNPLAPYGGGRDGYLLQANRDGELQWMTYLGGSDMDSARSVALQDDGQILVTGTTYSPEFTSGGFDTVTNGQGEAYLAVVDSNGQLQWTSYVGDGYSTGASLAVEVNGDVLLAGTTEADGWCEGGYDTALGIPSDAFVAKIQLGPPAAGISVSAPEQIVTGEDGTPDVFTVSLNTPPASDVLIPIQVSIPAEARIDSIEGDAGETLDAIVLNADHMTAMVTVVGVDDVIEDGDQEYEVQLLPATGDALYAGQNPPDVLAINRDDEISVYEFASEDVPVRIPDYHPKKGATPVTSTLTVADTGRLVDLVDIAIRIEQQSEYDLSVWLTSPTGTTQPVLYQSYSWLVEDPAAFQGESLDGTWTLTLQDNVKSFSGSLTAWTMYVTPQPATQATSALFLARGELLNVVNTPVVQAGNELVSLEEAALERTREIRLLNELVQVEKIRVAASLPSRNSYANTHDMALEDYEWDPFGLLDEPVNSDGDAYHWPDDLLPV